MHIDIKRKKKHPEKNLFTTVKYIIMVQIELSYKYIIISSELNYIWRPMRYNNRTFLIRVIIQQTVYKLNVKAAFYPLCSSIYYSAHATKKTKKTLGRHDNMLMRYPHTVHIQYIMRLK